MDWIAIRKEYESTEITLSDLAVKHGLKYPTVKSRKQREKWEKDASKKDASKSKKDASGKEKDASDNKKSKQTAMTNESTNKRETNLELSPNLTEKQKLFCLYYIKSYNATMSAIKAGYGKLSAHTEGSRLLRNVKVSVEIKRLKGRALQELFIDALDVLEVYVKIAFADITDYTEFGKSEDFSFVEGGKVIDEKGEYVKEYTNYVNLKNHDEIDGSLISEVKQGPSGISIKLHDKMKALEKLELYLDLLPDKHKRRIDDEKLKLDQAKFDMDKAKTTGSTGIDANNERILTLAKLLNNPVPNRNAEDFEDDDDIEEDGSEDGDDSEDGGVT